MKYKGIELKEITTPNIDNLPKKMLVWTFDDDEPSERVVCSTAIDNCGFLFFIARDSDEQRLGVCVWEHCAEIPEELKPRGVTNRKLARWLAEGKGEFTITGDTIYHFNNYNPKEADVLCNENWKIRKWDDTDWHEPTVDYMGLEGK